MNPDSTSLDRLHDLVVAPAVPLWPPAPGWYGVLGLVAVLLLTAGLRFLAYWQANRYRREALHELTRRMAAVQERPAAIAIMAELLKRAAMTAFSRENVASLTGNRWLQFLNETGQTQAFVNGPGHWLEDAIHNPGLAASLEEKEFQQLTSLVKHWLSHHRSPA